LRRKGAAFRRRANTYAKSISGLQRMLDVYWVIHHFIRIHFTTQKVPAVTLGVIDRIRRTKWPGVGATKRPKRSR